MSDQRFKTSIGIGATDELSLRVSVATLVRVVFEHPKDGHLLLALERRATFVEKGRRDAVEIKAQPFGGAIQMRNMKMLQDLIGNFHFDSEQSRFEQDFRLFIQPSAWEQVRQFCLRCFSRGDDAVLEQDPRRELTEEFGEILGIRLSPDQFTSAIVGTIVEDHPSPTDNFYARDFPTVRIYRIFESRILDTSLANELMTNSESDSNGALRERALQDTRNGGKGWASAVLTLPLKQVSAFYEETLPDVRNGPVSFQGHLLDETVAAVLNHITVPKYQRLLP